MPINWRTDYGIRLVYEIAKLGPGVRTTVRKLSESAEVPYDYARTIVRDLVAAGVLTSRRGVGGGVQLARPAEDIVVLDVFEALGEPPTLALCTDAGGICQRSDLCPMHVSIWNHLDGVIKEYLGSVSFAHTVAVGRALPVTPDGCA